MEENSNLVKSNWGLFILNKVIHPFTVFVTPLFILFLIIYFVRRAFVIDLYMGVRSFAGSLLPLVVVTFIFIFQKELLDRLGDISVLVSFFISFVIGVVVMKLVRFYASADSQTTPIIELALSGSFSVLVFSYVSIKENKMLSYYYGTVVGFLFYIVFFGFPQLK